MELRDIVKKNLKGISLDKIKGIITYLKTRDLLLKKGFINSYDKEAQELYWEFFSENKYLDENMEVLKNLQSENLELRLESAEYLMGEGCIEWSNSQKFWMIDPRTIDIVTKALYKETDDMVYRHLVIFLGMNAIKYGYNDMGVFDSIVHKYDELSDKTKIVIASEIFYFPTEKKWSYVSDALKIDDDFIAFNFATPAYEYKGKLLESIRSEMLLKHIEIVKRTDLRKVATEAIRTILDLITKEDVKLLKDVLKSKAIGEIDRKRIQSEIEEYESE